MLVKEKTYESSTSRPARGTVAASRIDDAKAMLRDCRLCGWDCGVDRTAGPTGRCHAGANARVFQQRMEWVGEADFVPTRLLNFSGCNFRCSFCLTGRDSQDARRGEAFDPGDFQCSLKADAGLYRTVTIEGGEASIFLPDALAAIAAVPPDVPVVWKTNGYSSDAALRQLEGCIDVFLADYKFGNDACAAGLAGVPDYLHHLQRNLHWASGHCRLIVRHLLMPGHIDCCFVPMMSWLENQMPCAELSIMNGFSAVWNSRRHPELLRGFSSTEREQVRALLDTTCLHQTPWQVAATPTEFNSHTEPADDHIYIGKDGSVRVAFMTAELKDALASLEAEFPVAVNLR